MEENRSSIDKTTHNKRAELDKLKKEIRFHVRSNLGQDPEIMNNYSCFVGLAYSVRDRLIGQWIETQQSCTDTLAKRMFYLSCEFLPGKFLMNYLTSLGIEELAAEAVEDLGFDLDEIEEEEWDAGLGNGGLGRLASCYMDSIASLGIPGYGYGIHYDYGIFHQTIVDGYQQEGSDNWMRRGNPWDILRSEKKYKIQFYGKTESYIDINGRERFRWIDSESLIAMACDLLIPGFKNKFVTNMRLWVALSVREFDLEDFNRGDYIGAVEAKILNETISKVLYPSDDIEKGRELRLKQQFFFVSASLQDILKQFKKEYDSFEYISKWAAIQLNDTHPSIAIPEFMRLLMDEEGLNWDEAWKVCQKTFAYTNHTVLPEALETWPVKLIGNLLPRHLEIILEINQRFLENLAIEYPDNPELLSKLSIIQGDGDQRIRMAHLAIVGSHSVNGVAALHTEILKRSLFKEFDIFYQGKIKNVTNGITPRRWLLQSNPRLSKLISSVIGTKWITDLRMLKGLIPYVDDSSFCDKWHDIKLENKKQLSRYTLRKTGVGVNPNSLFDIHVKRIHEYKRQLLNVLHIITLYNRILNGNETGDVKQTFFFAGKAAPAYFQAKLIIKLINSVSEAIDREPEVNERIGVVFLPNYCVSQAEKVIPAAEISEQISTAGMEASGTGNMKLSLNGALTIGTLDGANVEILEAVGKENMFIFGLKDFEVENLRSKGYDPRKYYNKDEELKKVLDLIDSGHFSPENEHLFKPITDSLLNQGDFFMLLADYRSYVSAQENVRKLYADQADWTKRSILTVANMGHFSSDRSVLDYAKNIWDINPLM